MKIADMTEEQARHLINRMDAFTAYDLKTKRLYVEGALNYAEFAALAWWLDNKPGEDLPFDDAPLPEVPPNPNGKQTDTQS